MRKPFSNAIRGGDDFPYIGVYEGEISVQDFADLDPGVELISFGQKTKNIERLAEYTAVKYVSTNTVSTEIIESLAQLPNLQVLSISGNKQEDWPSFKPLSQLEFLMLYNIKKVTSLDFLDGMKNLESLLMCEILQLSDLSAVASLKNLKEFSLEGDMHGRKSAVTDASAIFTLKKLEYLKLFTKKTKLEGSDFKALKSLQFLHARRSYFSGDVSEALGDVLPTGSEIILV